MRELLRPSGALLLAGLLAAPAGAQQWIPIEVRGGLLTFPALVEGTPTRAMLNTSAPHSSIDAAFAERLGLTLSGKRRRVSSALAGSRVVASEAQLDVALFGEKAVLRDTPALFHPETPLQLGAEFLEPFVLQIDYPGSRIRVLPRAELDLRNLANVPMRAARGSCRRRTPSSSLGDAGAGTGDFTRESFSRLGESADDTPCLPTVQVQFPGGRKLWLLLDTGASGPIVVSRAIAQRAGWLASHRSGSSTSSDVFGRRVALDLLVLPSVALGPFELGDVPVAVPAEGERVLGGAEAPIHAETGTHVARGARVGGRIGYDALRHFVVTIDVERQLLHVAPPQPAEAAAPPAR